MFFKLLLVETFAPYISLAFWWIKADNLAFTLQNNDLAEWRCADAKVK